MSPTISITPASPVVGDDVTVEVSYSSSPPTNITVTVKNLGTGQTETSGQGAPPVTVYFTATQAGDYRVIVSDGTTRTTLDFNVAGEMEA